MALPNLEEAVAFTTGSLQRLVAEGRRGQDYGYDMYAYTPARQWAEQQGPADVGLDHLSREASGVFMEAAWELCRRGVLRPGVAKQGGQGISGGNGYTITSAGERWLRNADPAELLLMVPGSLAETLNGFAGRFGEGYQQRVQDALICRFAQAWLACCSMVGAAAESVLLALAIAKQRDEDGVLDAYRRASGRRKVTDMLLQGLPEHLQIELKTFMSLLSYWRDDAAHGTAVDISQARAESYQSAS